MVAAVVVGELLGALIGLLEAPRHAPLSADTRYERPTSELDEHDALVAWPLLGAVAGATIGGAAIAAFRGARRLRSDGCPPAGSL